MMYIYKNITKLNLCQNDTCVYSENQLKNTGWLKDVSSLMWLARFITPLCPSLTFLKCQITLFLKWHTGLHLLCIRSVNISFIYTWLRFGWCQQQLSSTPEQLESDRKLPLKKMDDLPGWPCSPPSVILWVSFYTATKDPLWASQRPSALLVLTEPDISIDWILYLLDTRSCPFWLAKPWHRCLFL